MTILELYHEMRAALKGSADAATIDRLTTEASRFTSTVGWANGVIDKDGRIVEAFDSLREIAFARFKLENDSDMATLHDALADLIVAIRTHDEDLDPLSDSDEHDS
ncbi:MAG: hypothetical protein Q7S51_08445 [Gallionellaceae bacterium]|nr:hypothetical protein [Gallionellaceae bacterium]